ncbi:MAG: tetratricopeptide repeat protein [Alphaproteobacteria bacterium]
MTSKRLRSTGLLAAFALAAGLQAADAADLDAALAAHAAGDFAAAHAAFRELAQAGEVEAMYQLGTMSVAGEGTIANDSAAASWFRHAAERGHAEAQVRLGELYEQGRGVPLDYAAAATWYGKAAEQSVPAAQRQLGLMLIEGRGGAIDEAAGRAWLERAAAAGDAEASAYLAPPPEPAEVAASPTIEPAPAGEVAVPAEAEAQAQAPAEAFVAEPADPNLSLEAKRLYDFLVADLVRLTPPGATIRHGQILVEETGAAFRVVMPDVTFISHVDRFKVNLGTFVADATPLGNDVYGIDMVLPELMTVDDKDGNEVAHAMLGESRFEGTWAPATGGYLDQTMTLGDIVVASAEAGVELRIARARYDTALVPSGEARVTGPSAYAIEGITLSDGQGREIARIGAIRGTSEVRDLDRGILTRLNNGMAALDQASRQLGASPDLSFLPTEPGAILGGARMDVTFEDVVVSTPMGDGFNIARLSYATSVDGLDTPLARFDMQYRHDGLRLAGPEASALVPDLANLDIAIERLPAAHLYGLALAAGISALANPAAAPEALFADLPRVFAEAGTELKVAALDLAAAGAEAHASGSVTGDPVASGGVIGSFTMFASGLDGAIERLGADPNDMNGQQAAFFLTLLQSLGAPETNEGGEPVLAYRIELSPDGKHTLNGQDIEALMGGLMGGQPQP